MKPTQFHFDREHYRVTEQYRKSHGLSPLDVPIPVSLKKPTEMARRGECCQCPGQPEYLFGLCWKCYKEKGRQIACDHEDDE